MLINFPLKHTRPIEYMKTIEAFIMRQYQESSLFDQVKPSIERAQKIRNSMDFDKINLSIANDLKTSEDLEQNLITYIRYLQIFNKRLRFEHNDQGSVQASFMWSCSYNPTQMAQSNSIKYEMAATYYNLAITEYYLGSAKLLKETDLDRKQAISRLRNGVWAIDQCKQIVPLLPQDIVSQHIDFSMANLDALEKCLMGLSYKALYENIATNEKAFGLNNVASTLNEAAKEFKLALQNAKSLQQQYGKKIKEQTLTTFITALNYNYLWCHALTCIKMAQFHQSKIQDEPRGQNMGKALGFLFVAEQAIVPVVQDKANLKIYTSYQLDSLKSFITQIASIKADYEKRNSQIYKEQIVQEGSLPYPPVTENLKIKALMPPIFNETLEDEKNFESFVSEEAMQLTREIKGIVEQRKYELDEAFKVLNDQKNKAYGENFVNLLIDMIHGQGIQQTAQLPNSLKQKIENIRSRGGLSGAQKLIDQSKSMSGQCGQLIGSIKQKIEQEKQVDNAMRQLYGGAWKRQHSDNLTREFINTINDLQNKTNQAQTVDFEIIEFIELTQKPDPDIAQQLPKQENNSEFLQANQTQINQITQLDQQINQRQEEMKQLIFKFYEIINQTNFVQAAMQAIQQGTPKTQVFEQALAPVTLITDQFNEKMKEVSLLVTQICGQSSQLSQSKRQSQSKTNSNNFSSGFSSAQEFFENIDFGLAFYLQLISHLQDLDRKISDYICARNIEKDDLVHLIQNPQINQQNQGQQNQGHQNQGQQGFQPQYPHQQQQQQYPNQQQPNQQYPNQYPNQYPQQGQQQQGQQSQQGYQNPQYNPQQQQGQNQGQQLGQWGNQNQPQQGQYQYQPPKK